jgi:hypothetical protein
MMGNRLLALLPKRSVSAVLVVTTSLAMTLPPSGWALIAPARLSQSQQTSSDAARAADMRIIQKTLESKILRQRLMDYGLSPQETDRRLTQLSNAQIHQLAMESKRLNPGGDLLIGLVVLGILVLIFIILLKKVL